ncbi:MULTISPECIES: hypothetical protein [Legionella]|uniref:Uncharacterized protein n=1 Tax=Legionella resiliens TaxID=2905958 RepID=A0ABS8WWU7_9GAMM|nr:MULTISPECIES: hypothetical protein [unclassified Legionella]MCE0721787.1 hypothetical protein [Legionella sp. 9fVS26]MCE3530941.1 hypothetical protein [Legionella sp. 8cVS16]QLZ70503.1 hypothetical protein FOLKNPGA_03317 [Legionella sp. PC1000]
MPSRIQPEHIIGPNNAGKMILRGCFMNISKDWIEQTSNQVGGLLTRYLKDRHEEATEITLGYGENVPEGREERPHKLDIEFMANVVNQLRRKEKSGTDLQQARPEDIEEQVADQVVILRLAIEDYEAKCAQEGIDPMFTGVPGVIIANVLSREVATHAQSMRWAVRDAPPVLDLFEGLQIHDAPNPPS